MVEKDSGSTAPKDPTQNALDRGELLGLSPDYDKERMQRAINKVRQKGARTTKSPGELYARLAELAGIATEIALDNNKVEDAAEFIKQQELLQKTSEQFQIGEDVPKKTSKKSSKLRQTTGKASG